MPSISDGKSQSDATWTYGAGSIVNNHASRLFGRFTDLCRLLHDGLRSIPENRGGPSRYDSRICGSSDSMGHLGRSQRDDGLVERLARQRSNWQALI